MPLRSFRTPVKAKETDQTASRAFDTTYQNTTGRPLLCIVTLTVATPAVADQAYGTAYSADVTPPTVICGRCGSFDEDIHSAYFCMVFIIPNGNYYRIVRTTLGTGTLAIYKWWEVEL